MPQLVNKPFNICVTEVSNLWTGLVCMACTEGILSPECPLKTGSNILGLSLQSVRLSQGLSYGKGVISSNFVWLLHVLSPEWPFETGYNILHIVVFMSVISMLWSCIEHYRMFLWHHYAIICIWCYDENLYLSHVPKTHQLSLVIHSICNLGDIYNSIFICHTPIITTNWQPWENVCVIWRYMFLI